MSGRSLQSHRSRPCDGGAAAPKTLATCRAAGERWRPGAANPAGGKDLTERDELVLCRAVARVTGERRNRPAYMVAEMIPGTDREREKGRWTERWIGGGLGLRWEGSGEEGERPATLLSLSV